MKTILLIEDNIDIRENTAELLELSNYHVLKASNGKVGLDLAFQHKPDLILCDIMMPELDGYGVLYLLSKNPETAFIPFIFLTAKAEHIDFRKGMELGADDYLTKPFDGLELLHSIESRIAKKETQKDYYSTMLSNIDKLTSTSGKGLSELNSLILSRKIRHIKKKQVLYYDGDTPQGLYLILEGGIKTIKLAEDGRELITALYKSEDYLGVNALLMDEAFTETAEAVEDSTICILPKEAVMSLLNQYTDIGNLFIKILSKNIKEKEEQLLELAYHSVRKRLAHVLVKLSKQNEGLQLKVSRDELAAMAGIASETVSRTLTDFKNEGLILKKGSDIQILLLPRLLSMKN